VSKQILALRVYGSYLLSFARAKTGTGKTMAFLIPTIQQLIVNPPAHSRLISILVISPTRELAMQIMAEAQKLINNNPNIGVQCVVGGTNINSEKSRLSSQRTDILVAVSGQRQCICHQPV
jgi:ATP-dependent RNA helicase MSS116, mitochondrial